MHPHMPVVRFYQFNIPYIRIFDFFTKKYTYLQVSVKNLLFISHAVYDKN